MQNRTVQRTCLLPICSHTAPRQAEARPRAIRRNLRLCAADQFVHVVPSEQILDDTGRVDLTGWVMRDGVVARASGRVLVIDGTVWFEMPLPAIAIWPPLPPRQGPHAVRAHGVDLDRLDHAKHHDGGILEGWTTLTGTWRQGELHVRDQTSTPPAQGWTNPWTTPPCPPPATGWPTVPIHGPHNGGQPAGTAAATARMRGADDHAAHPVPTPSDATGAGSGRGAP
jgi:hypothetical protein